MRRRLLAAAVAVLAVAATIAALAWARRSGPSFDPKKTNVVVLIACTFRADQLGLYGNPVDPMPYLTTRAARGTVFDRVISAAPWTKPATAALITGRWPTAIGMVQPEGGLDRRKLAAPIETLAERMKASGRRTIGGTANPNANARFGFDQGFDAYIEPPTLWHEGEFTKIDGRTVVDGVLSELKSGPKSPFYLQLLLVDAHLPFQLGDEAKRWDDNKVSRRVTHYRAMLYALDARIQRLVDGLAALGHTDEDTLFVVVGDHGEGLKMPTHHGNGHGFYLYPSTVHVPMVAWGPGIEPGRRVSALTSSVDLAPTLAGLVKSPFSSSDGKDSSSVWTAKTGRPLRTQAFTSTFFKAADRAAIYTSDRMCQRAFEAVAPERTKTKAPFPNNCYDWERDPDALETVDAPELEADLAAWHEEQARLVRANGGSSVEIDDETMDALEGLGYVE